MLPYFREHMQHCWRSNYWTLGHILEQFGHKMLELCCTSCLENFNGPGALKMVLAINVGGGDGATEWNWLYVDQYKLCYVFVRIRVCLEGELIL